MEKIEESLSLLLQKFDSLKEDVDDLKKKDTERTLAVEQLQGRSLGEDYDNSGSSSGYSRRRDRSRSRGRSPTELEDSSRSGAPRSPGSRSTRSSARHLDNGGRHARLSHRSESTSSWAQRMEENPNETPNYEEQVAFSDDDEAGFEVSDKTGKFLEDCMKPMPFAKRSQLRSEFGGLPRVPWTKTPKLDGFLKPELPAPSTSLDKDLARVQHHLLDAMGPLAAIIDADHSSSDLSHQEVLTAVKNACRLIGNASSRLSNLRREKAITEVNKSLLPLVKEESFSEASPNLFGSGFAKKSKEYIDQVKAMRSTLSKGNRESAPMNNRQSFFRNGPPKNRGDTTKATSTTEEEEKVSAREPTRTTPSTEPPKTKELNCPNTSPLGFPVKDVLNLTIVKYLRDMGMIELHTTGKVAGRLQFFVANWKLVTKDPWVLDTIQGYAIDLHSEPVRFQHLHHSTRISNTRRNKKFIREGSNI